MARSRRRRCILLIIVGAVILLPAVGLLIILLRLGPLIRAGVEVAGRRALGVETRLGGASVALTRGRVTLTDLSVANPEGFEGDAFFKADEIHVQADLSALMRNEIHIREILLDSPEILYESAGLKTNAGVLVSRVQGDKKQTKSSAAPPGPAADPREKKEEGSSTTLKIDLVRLTNVRVHVRLEKARYEIKLGDVRIRNIADKNGNAIPVDQVVQRVLADLIKPIEKTLAASRKLQDMGRDATTPAEDEGDAR